jgi:phospholipid/cholesterol/gamma-HCH transport system substrate-binding protein
MTQIAWWRSPRVAIVGILCAAALVVVVALGTSAGGSSGGYTVRAIFDDAGNVITGEDVKIDGVKVGAVGAVTPTPGAKAAVVLKIENPGFQDFRADASCTVRPQALIGEKYVDCLPTQPRVEGTPLPPPLHRLSGDEAGTDEGAGQYYLPVTNTHSPVDPDLIGDNLLGLGLMRLPERQRFTILVNEFGAGLAGRGSDLNAVIRRANPALQELEKVLSILAGENKVLTDLAVEGDRAIAPLAADRGKLADFITQSKTVAQASANHAHAIGENFAAFPAFLEQLGPQMERLGRFAQETTPTFTDLGVAAPGIDKTFESLAPFARSSEKFFSSLGSTAKTTGPALQAVEPLLSATQPLGKAAKPFASNFSSLFTSLRSTGGLERLLDFIYLGTGSVNGYDALGHFLRAEIVAGVCLTYEITPTAGCPGKFIGGASSARATAAKASTTSVVMERTLAVLNGMTPAQAIAKYPGATPGEGGTALPGSPAPGSQTTAQPAGGTAAGTTYYTPVEEGSEAGGTLLNYLLGN